uniref:Uncharacterized protein n=1 Tax=Arundo donax TaxID=35708 RepID=A0A0A9GUY4_ARUDO
MIFEICIYHYTNGKILHPLNFALVSPLTTLVLLSPSSSSSSSTKTMCQSVALRVASTQDVHQMENKTAEMNPTSDLVPAVDADDAVEEPSVCTAGATGC